MSTPSDCSQLELMHTHLSPFGRFNLVTRVPRVHAEAMAVLLGNQPLCNWSNVDIAHGSSTGSNHCFRTPNGPDSHPDWVFLHWKPDQLEDCLASYTLLSRTFDCAYRESHGNRVPLVDLRKLTQPALILSCVSLERGYVVHGSFSPPVWDLLENHSSAVLPPVNQLVQHYWEERLNREAPGQYATVRDGLDGATFQMMHPVGSELSIAGARNPRGGPHQLTDHNTDSPEHALAHIITMCAIVSVCKEIWPAIAQQPVLKFA